MDVCVFMCIIHVSMGIWCSVYALYECHMNVSFPN